MTDKNAAVSLTVEYIRRVRTLLGIEVPAGCEPVFREVDPSVLQALKSSIMELLRRSGTSAIDAIRASEGAEMQVVAYGLFDDLDVAVRVGYLIGDRVVLWEYLGERLLRDAETTPERIDQGPVGAVANALVALEPLAAAGQLIILPHPLSWHEPTQAAVLEAERRELLTPWLLGAIASFMVASDLHLHPYTVAASEDEYRKLVGLKAPASTNAPDAAARTTVAALSAGRLLSDERFSHLLDLPATQFAASTAGLHSLYREVRDRLVGESPADIDYRREDLARHLEGVLELRNESARATADHWAQHGAVFTGTLSLVSTVLSGGPALAAGSSALGWLLAVLRASLPGAGNGDTISAVFRRLSLREAQSDYVKLHNVEERHLYLEGLPPWMAQEVIDSVSDHEVERTINVRETWHDYCCDFLGYVWGVSPSAFWRHVKTACSHPDGLVVGDNPAHWELLCSEDIPADVWSALLDTMFCRGFPRNESLQRAIVAQTGGGRARHMRKRGQLRCWLADLHPGRRAEAKQFLEEAFGGCLPEWLEDVIGDWS